MNLGIALLASALALLPVQLTLAHILSFDPPAQSVGLGSVTTVKVRASDLDPTGLGNFDFDFFWDPAILSLNSTLNEFALGRSIGLGIVAGLGTVKFSDFSLEDPIDLLANQSDDEVLFTLRFNAIGLGTSALTFLP